MIIEEIIKWFLLLLFLLLVQYLLRKLARKWQDDQRNAYGGSSGGEGSGGDGGPGDQHPEDTAGEAAEREWWQQAEQRAREAARNQQEARVREILKKDPTLSEDLCKHAGTEHKPAEQILKDPAAVRELARKLPNITLDILETASRQAAVDLDLRSRTSLQEVRAGGVYTDRARMKGLDQLPDMDPLEFAYPERYRWHRMLTGKAQRTRRWNIVSRKKLLYVLEDVSGSMLDSRMRDGKIRFVWARGITYKLAQQAVAGGTPFVHRVFDASPHRAHKATTRQEAQKFLDWAIATKPEGGGTNIYNALHRAVEDIEKGVVDEADILLISDGEDESTGDPDRVRALLAKGKKKIKLHVILIGGDNESLKEVATTYQVFK